MGYKHTFSMKASKNAKSVEFALNMPSTLDDMDLIVKRYGSVERLINRANAQHIVDVANNGGRKTLTEQGTKAAEKFISTFLNDGKKRAVTRPTISAKEAKALGFTPEQLVAIAAKGMRIE